MNALPVRVENKIDRTATCWLWIGAKSDQGYGVLRGESASGSSIRAHRYVYEALVGPIPNGLVIDHLCRVVACVNPAHLEPVTSRENTLRGIGPAAIAAQQTHCLAGHPWSQENVIMQEGKRRCRTCRRAQRASQVACDLCGVSTRSDNIARHRKRNHPGVPVQQDGGADS